MIWGQLKAIGEKTLPLSQFPQIIMIRLPLENTLKVVYLLSIKKETRVLLDIK